MTYKEKIGILIPVYNESGTLSNLISKIKDLDYLKKNFESFEILVIDDGSDDETQNLLNKMKEVTTITHGYNMGVGAAVRNGLTYFENKNFDYVIKIDGDGQHEINEIKNLVEPLKVNEADLVYGDRFNGVINYEMPKYRILGNKFFTYVLRKLTKYKITDAQPGFFAGNKKFLSSFYILTNYNYTQQVIYSSYLAGLRFIQKPITFNQRLSGESFVKFSYPFKALLQILLLIIIKKPLSIFGYLGTILIFTSVVIASNQIYNYLYLDAAKPIININLVLGFGISGIILFITAVILKAIQNLEETKRRKVI